MKIMKNGSGKNTNTNFNKVQSPELEVIGQKSSVNSKP
jgi:hypothetical protein